MIPWWAERILADPLLSSHHHRRRPLPGAVRASLSLRPDSPGRNHAPGRVAAGMAARAC